jgi:hypothetical protein
MRKFTVKDFIEYNGPCFSCDNPINFKIGFQGLNNADASFLRPTVTATYTEIDLRITYNNSLQLFIFHQTNKILTNDPGALTEYLSSHKLFLSSTCDHCLSLIESQFLDFHISQGYVAAVGISNERLLVKDKGSLYQINTSMILDKSLIVVDRIDKTRPISPFTLELPALPLYRFKDKQHFLDKIKKYILFS